MKQYEFRVRAIKLLCVTVEAETLEEAEEKADGGEWLDEQDADLIDWDVQGPWEKCR